MAIVASPAAPTSHGRAQAAKPIMRRMGPVCLPVVNQRSSYQPRIQTVKKILSPQSPATAAPVTTYVGASGMRSPVPARLGTQAQASRSLTYCVVPPSKTTSVTNRARSPLFNGAGSPATSLATSSPTSTPRSRSSLTNSRSKVECMSRPSRIMSRPPLGHMKPGGSPRAAFTSQRATPQEFSPMPFGMSEADVDAIGQSVPSSVPRPSIPARVPITIPESAGDSQMVPPSAAREVPEETGTLPEEVQGNAHAAVAVSEASSPHEVVMGPAEVPNVLEASPMSTPELEAESCRPDRPTEVTQPPNSIPTPNKSTRHRGSVVATGAPSVPDLEAERPAPDAVGEASILPSKSNPAPKPTRRRGSLLDTFATSTPELEAESAATLQPSNVVPVTKPSRHRGSIVGPVLGTEESHFIDVDAIIETELSLTERTSCNERQIGTLDEISLIRGARGIDCCTACPTCYRVVAENSGNRLVEMNLPVGVKDQAHDHPVHYVYVVDGGRLKLSPPPGGILGESVEVDLPSGRALVLPAGPHQVENVGETDVKMIMMEPAPTCKLCVPWGDFVSSFETCPGEYQVLAEDDDWLIGKLAMPAGSTDLPHSHREHLAVALTGEARRTYASKVGDQELVVTSGTAFSVPACHHVVTNAGPDGFEMIFFELKR